MATVPNRKNAIQAAALFLPSLGLSDRPPKTHAKHNFCTALVNYGRPSVQLPMATVPNRKNGVRAYNVRSPALEVAGMRL